VDGKLGARRSDTVPHVSVQPNGATRLLRAAIFSTASESRILNSRMGTTARLCNTPFTYNTSGWGELASMTLPTGATVFLHLPGIRHAADSLGSLYMDPVTSKTVQWQDVNSPGSR